MNRPDTGRIHYQIYYLGKTVSYIRNEWYFKPNLISAELKARIAPSTIFWAIGPATAPIKYNAVWSTYDMVSVLSIQQD